MSRLGSAPRSQLPRSRPTMRSCCSPRARRARARRRSHRAHRWPPPPRERAARLARRRRWLVCLPLAHAGGAVDRDSLLARRQADPPRRRGRRSTRRRSRHSCRRSSRNCSTIRRGGHRRRLRAVLLGGAAAPPALIVAALDRGVPVSADLRPHRDVRPGRDRPRTRGCPVHCPASRSCGGTVRRARTDSHPRRRCSRPVISTAADRARARDGGPRLRRARRVHVLGRADDVIITGGENVHPTQVEAVLAARPACARRPRSVSPIRVGDRSSRLRSRLSRASIGRARSTSGTRSCRPTHGRACSRGR